MAVLFRWRKITAEVQSLCRPLLSNHTARFFHRGWMVVCFSLPEWVRGWIQDPLHASAHGLDPIADIRFYRLTPTILLIFHSLLPARRGCPAGYVALLGQFLATK